MRDANEVGYALECDLLNFLLIVTAIDGAWSEWHEWGECSKTCGRGAHVRLRVCDNPPPSDGGKDCSGDVTELQRCNYKKCGECRNAGHVTT